MDLLMQLLGLVLLLGAVGWGYRRWVAPREGAIDFQGRGLLVLIVLTLVGGFIGAPFWWMDDPRTFSWDLPPLAGRMLGVAAWSFVVVSFLALERPTRRRVRLVLTLLAVYLAPLVAAAVLFHLGRFDFAVPLTYGFFIIAAGMTVGALWYLARQPDVAVGTTENDAPASVATSVWLGVVAVVTGLWGLALFVTDSGPSPLVWAWRGDLLTSRLIAVMLLAIAAGAVTARRYQDTARMMLAMTTTYGVGLAVAALWNGLAGRPIPMGYVAVFGVIGLGSIALLLMAPRQGRASLAGNP